ncbi:MAG TPA: WYL domain-containing protein [Roseiflexaceae bacterium]|jgi:predicted DNA-binding transcriptional regulator YafY
MLRFRLLPVVARRRDVAAYFPNTQLAYHDDGSATITATVTNLWQTRQILLRYGDACVVLEPSELVELFRKTARELAPLYGGAENC